MGEGEETPSPCGTREAGGNVSKRGYRRLKRDLAQAAIWITYRSWAGAIRETGELQNDWCTRSKELALRGEELHVTELVLRGSLNRWQPLPQDEVHVIRVMNIPLDRVERIECRDADHHCYGGPSIIWSRNAEGRLMRSVEGTW